MAAVTKVGKGPGPFLPEMCWATWWERFEFFIQLKGVTDVATKRLLLFTEMGQVYEELRRMAQPDDVRTMDLAEIEKLMVERFGEAKSIAACRHELFSAKQQTGQSIRDYSVQLRSLIAKAEWSRDSIDMCLCALFINGISNDSIRVELIKKGDKDLKFKDAVESAVLLEQSNLDAQAIGSNAMPEVAKVGTQQRGPRTPTKSTRSCFRCGKPGHFANMCPKQNSTCRKCGKVGHWAVGCKSKNRDGNANFGQQFGQKPRTNGRQIKNIECSNVSVIHEIKGVSADPGFIQLNIYHGKLEFELDSGADVTVIDEIDWKRIGKPKLEQSQGLVAYGGKSIGGILGKAKMKVTHEGRTIESNIHVISGKHKNLCGRDLIMGLKIDLNRAFGISTIRAVETKNELDACLAQYPEVFQDGVGRCKKTVSLKFKEGCQPKRCKPRPVPFSLRNEVEKVLDQWQSEKIIEPVATSEWATPLVIVPKANGKLRLCFDYKITVNPWLDIHQYPLPRPEELFSILNGGEKFTKIDLKDAYLQLLLDEKAKSCLTICTHKGLFHFARLPFGVASAPAIFQQVMEEVLQGIDGVAVYLDDILITAATDQQHVKRIDQVLKRLSENGLRVKREKCEFLKSEIEYLGHIVDKNGLHASPGKIEAILKMPEPKNLKELQSFLGMVNYYGKFVPSLATLSESLNELRRNDAKWTWAKSKQKAFDGIKTVLTSTEVLVHYDPQKPLFLAADASDYGVGAVIFHKNEKGKVGVIAYASRTLNSSERNYSQIEKEARAIIFGVDKFKQYLYGRKFVLQTDHEPLKKIFGPKGELPIVAAKRLHRWSLILMNFDFEVVYCSTKEFGNADGLSRLPCPEETTIDHVGLEVQQIQNENISCLPVTVNVIAKEVKKDGILQKVREFIEKGWPQKVEEGLKSFYVIRNELALMEGCIMFGNRTIIPSKFRTKMLEILHATHPGMVRMKALARQKMWWPGIDKEIEMIRKRCKICQEEAPDERKVPLHPWESPERPWQRIHIDFCGPFWGSMWLIIMDAKSKWPEVVRMRTTTALATIEALRIVFTAHGLPEQIVSDNGPQFSSKEFGDYCQSRGIVHTLIAPYNPKSNGAAERFVQTFKQGMNKLQKEGMKQEIALSQFLLKYRVTPHAATELAPSEILFGRRLRTLLDLVKPTAANDLEAAKMQKGSYAERMKRNFDRGTNAQKNFEVNQRVYARNYRDGSKWIPGQITRKIGSAMFLVRTARGMWKRHSDQLKENWTEEPSDNSSSEGADNSDSEDEVPIEVMDDEQQLPAPPEEQQQPEQPQPQANDEPRRSTRKRKKPKIFDPSA